MSFTVEPLKMQPVVVKTPTGQVVVQEHKNIAFNFQLCPRSASFGPPVK